jgi:hypothetical protein
VARPRESALCQLLYCSLSEFILAPGSQAIVVNFGRKNNLPFEVVANPKIQHPEVARFDHGL